MRINIFMAIIAAVLTLGIQDIAAQDNGIREILVPKDVFTKVDVKPSMADKKTGVQWEDSVKHLVSCPPTAKRYQIQGRLVFQFIVEKNGTISAPRCLMHLVNDIPSAQAKTMTEQAQKEAMAQAKTEMTAEAGRALMKLPPCKPATVNGKPVRYLANMLVQFNLP